jgi:hypothetical protein
VKQPKEPPTARNGLRRWLSEKGEPPILGNLVRAAFAVIAVVSFYFGIVAMMRHESPEIGGTALVIVSVLLIAVALIGRLPNRLAFKDWEVEFRQDSLEQILTIVRSEAPEILEQVVSVARGGSRTPKAVEDAVKAVKEQDRAEHSFERDVLIGGLQTSVDNRPDPFKTLPGLEYEVDVPVPSRGRPPRIDASLQTAQGKVAIEVLNTWTNTNANLVPQRLARALTNIDYIAAAIVLPREAISAAQSDIEDRRILVVTPDQVSRLPELVAARLRELGSL